MENMTATLTLTFGDKDHSSNRPDDKIGFSMDRIRDEMARIDMKDDEDIERRIESILNSIERNSLTFTEEHDLAYARAN